MQHIVHTRTSVPNNVYTATSASTLRASNIKEQNLRAHVNNCSHITHTMNTPMVVTKENNRILGKKTIQPSTGGRVFRCVLLYGTIWYNNPKSSGEIL